MQIIKKFDLTTSLERLNASIVNLNCYGISLPAKLDHDGSLTINGYTSCDFIQNLLPTALNINVHLFNQKKLTDADYHMIARELKLLSERLTSDDARVILSSSHLNRWTLELIRYYAILINEWDDRPSLVVASNDDITSKSWAICDMIYSGRSKSKQEYEFDRLTDYIKNGVPVLLDWQDNYQQRIHTMMEKTDNSDKLLVLSENPKKVRQMEKKYFF